MSAAGAQVSYEDLYARWERGNWRATEVDFTQDKVDWRDAFDDFERRAALWNYAMFFHGEDAVADDLSPFIDAAPREEQKYFLATQQVDEARHAVFFNRFMHEVVERGDGTVVDVVDLEAAALPLELDLRAGLHGLEAGDVEVRADRDRRRLALRLGRAGEEEGRARRHDGDGRGESADTTGDHWTTISPAMSLPCTAQ